MTPAKTALAIAHALRQCEVARAGGADLPAHAACLAAFRIRCALPSICERRKKPARAALAVRLRDTDIPCQEISAARGGPCPRLYLHRRADICRKVSGNPWRHEPFGERPCTLARAAAAEPVLTTSESRLRERRRRSEACPLLSRREPERRESAPSSRCQGARAGGFRVWQAPRHCA